MSEEVVKSGVMSQRKARPRPVVTPDSEPFWTSVHEHAMRLPRCQSCTQFFFPPSSFCPSCWSQSIDWVAVRGTGSVVSYVTFQRLYNPAFSELIPYDVVLVELDEGPRMLSRIDGECHPSVDARVEVVYDDVDEETTLPLFQVIGESR